MSTVDTDVAIVGYGPVGQTMAALLAARGHRVSVYERYGEPYGLPRAVFFDDNTIRVWQSLGIVEELSEDLLATSRYDWFGADGDPILRLELPSPAGSGWEPGYMGFQPYVEDALDRAVKAIPSAAVHRGWRAEGLRQDGDHVELTLGRVHEPSPGRLEPTAQRTSVRARYVVGADGANSFVREASGIAFEDQGFAERWLVVDLRPHDTDALAHLDVPCQWCDPSRPHMQTPNGRRHRRFEFMLLPGERAEDFAGEASVWRLLEPWVNESDAVVVRHAVYEFRARLARSMNAGRALLVGDAAHTMPPFMGQGLNSGVRDTSALVWRLDLLLRGLAEERLLDSYTAEQSALNEWVVNVSAEMGRVSCVLDAKAAAERDAAMRAAEGPGGGFELPPLEGGLISDTPMAGTRAVQGTVRHAGRSGRFDDVVGRGFVLLSRHRASLRAEQSRFLESVGAILVALEDLEDLDGRLTAWLDKQGIDAVMIRPDFYVFGATQAAEQASELVEDLRAQLSPTQEGAPPMATDTPVAHPKFHHVNLKTTRLQEMIDWYSTVLGAEVIHQYALGAWITNDEANHRIALLAFPGFVEDPDQDTRCGLHHTAFEYDSFEELNAAYLRLKAAGITPEFCLDHGMTFSYYYKDPDGNRLELQVDNFGDWAKSSAWMRDSLEFQEDPLGKFVDPDRVAEAYASGTGFEEIHARAIAGELAPETAPIELPQVEA